MGEKENKKISIEDVAKRAGVSITTVSRVLNNVSTVADKNRVKVEEAIAFFKFKPNVSAQRLARGVNNSIALVIPGYPGVFHSFYAIELIRGVGHACEVLKMDLLLHISSSNNPFNPHTVGGIVFADIIENRRQVDAAIAAGVPAVVINNRVNELDINYIAVDNEKGGEIAADYLVSLGHKRIATVTGNLNTQAGAERLDGFKKYLEKKKIDLPKEYIFHGDYSRRCARQAIEDFLKLPNKPTAIFAASDEMALEMIATLLEKGIKVPDEISVIGFDDNPACLYGAVALTTIRQPLFQMAEDSVRQIHSIVSGKGKVKNKVIMSPELVVRESCSPPKRS